MNNANSLLFVPGNRPERFAKALQAGADVVVIDLEDAVGPADKDTARAALAAWLDPAHPVMVRINAAETGSAITGTAEANATIALTLGTGNVRTVTANGSGTWTYTLVADDITAMGQGAETLSATATDAAGNTSVAGTRAITIDTIAPATPTIDTVAGDNTISSGEEQGG